MESAIRLEHAFTYRTSVTGPEVVGDGPYGMRHYYEMSDGVLDGDRLSGRTIGGGGDWMLVGEDGFLRMDVRLQVRTADGAVVGIRYFGPAEANPTLRAAIAANGSTRFGDQRIRTHWVLEAGDPRYAWVNRSIFVGEGRVAPDTEGRAGFEHRVYRVG